jgi:hypothetical protein
VIIAVAVASASKEGAVADPNVLCHRGTVKQWEKYKKTRLKVFGSCRKNGG